MPGITLKVKQCGPMYTEQTLKTACHAYEDKDMHTHQLFSGCTGPEYRQDTVSDRCIIPHSESKHS